MLVATLLEKLKLSFVSFSHLPPRPHFGAIPPLSVSRGVAPGSVLHALRANDIDLAPPVTYKLARPNDYFIVDTYTGQLQVLRSPPEAEAGTDFVVVASDGEHEARATVRVEFKEDEDSCRPRDGRQEHVSRWIKTKQTLHCDL